MHLDPRLLKFISITQLSQTTPIVLNLSTKIQFSHICKNSQKLITQTINSNTQQNPINNYLSSILFTRDFHSSNFQNDHYQTLGVSKSASQAEIKKAFHKLAREYHPDISKAPDAQKKFQEVSNAYEVLGDEKKRKSYDSFGHEAYSQHEAGGGFDASQMDFEDILRHFGMGGGDFGGGGGNPFGGGGGNPFGGGGGNPFGGGGFDPFEQQQQSNEGSHVEVRVRINFMDAVKGTEVPVEYRVDATCTTCSGSGAKPGTSKSKCKTCDGQGMVYQMMGPITMPTECPACRGSGFKIKHPCGTCKGSGTTSTKKKLTVNIPPGVNDGSNVRVRGQGNAGRNNGKAGHLYVKVSVEKHENFKRDGNDIHLDIPIPVSTAILGGKVRVPTLEGHVDVQIKAGTQPDTTNILRRKGVKTNRETGHQYLHFKVVVPKKMSEKQKELITEFGEEEGASFDSDQSNPGFLKGAFSKLKDIFGK